jgi:hypothetical protein
LAKAKRLDSLIIVATFAIFIARDFPALKEKLFVEVIRKNGVVAVPVPTQQKPKVRAAGVWFHMLQIHVIQLHLPSGGSVGAMESAEKVFVLQTVTERWFFADWTWNSTTRKPNTKFVGHLSCARGFRSQQLAQAFQRFLAWNGHICDLCEAESGRLVSRYSPEPRKQPRPLPAQIRVLGLAPKKNL